MSAAAHPPLQDTLGTGRRLLRRADAGVSAAALGAALVQACGELDLSGVHITFCTEDEWSALGEAGWLQRLGTQFHWENAGFATFDDFLGTLRSSKRKTLRRERRDANAASEILCVCRYRLPSTMAGPYAIAITVSPRPR